MTTETITLVSRDGRSLQLSKKASRLSRTLTDILTNAGDQEINLNYIGYDDLQKIIESLEQFVNQGNLEVFNAQILQECNTDNYTHMRFLMIMDKLQIVEFFERLDFANEKIDEIISNITSLVVKLGGGVTKFKVEFFEVMGRNPSFREKQVFLAFFEKKTTTATKTVKEEIYEAFENAIMEVDVDNNSDDGSNDDFRSVTDFESSGDSLSNDESTDSNGSWTTTKAVILRGTKKRKGRRFRMTFPSRHQIKKSPTVKPPAGADASPAGGADASPAVTDAPSAGADASPAVTDAPPAKADAPPPAGDVPPA